MKKKPAKPKLPKIPKDWKDNLLALPLVLVEWVDATTLDGWWSWESWQEREPTVIKTVGYLLPSASKFLRVAPTVGRHGAFADPWMIPSAWIKSVRRLR